MIIFQYLLIVISFFSSILLLAQGSIAWQCVGPADTNCLQCHAAAGGGSPGANPYPEGYLHTLHGSLDCTLCHCGETGISTCTPSSQPVQTHCCTTCHDGCLKVEEHTSTLRYNCRSCHDLFDSDTDGLSDCADNCPFDQNQTQEDTSPPEGNGIGDACDCEGNFDCDQDVDGTDASSFKVDFGRSSFNSPCTSENPCKGDFECDGDVDGTDASLFKEDFGRSSFNTPCPLCQLGNWCSYGDSRLDSNCFNWPEEDFTPGNHAGITVSISEGEQAIDFTLKDPGGTIYTLSSLLQTKPVLMVFGAFT